MQSFPNEDEISLLDLLVVVAENIKLLLIGPLLVGLAALGITYVLPKTYESTAWLRLGEAAAADIKSTDVLVPLLDSAPWVEQDAKGLERKLDELSKHITASFNKKDGLLKLQVQAPTSEQAQKLNQALIAAYRQYALPKGQALVQINEQIALNQSALKELQPVIQRIGDNIHKVTPGTEGDNVARAYINLTEQRMQREKALQDLNRQLRGFGDEVIAQSPTLPEKSIKPKKALTAVLATLAAGFALLLFVFARSAWRNSQNDAEAASKLVRIRKALGLKV